MVEILMMRYHPDKPTGSVEKFRDVEKAYRILTDELARWNYERYGNPDGPSAVKVLYLWIGWWIGWYCSSRMDVREGRKSNCGDWLSDFDGCWNSSVSLLFVWMNDTDKE